MNYDETKFKQMMEYANDLAHDNASRREMLEAMRSIYFLEDEETRRLRDQFKNILLTYSPDSSNAVETAVRLMTANQPGISVPEEMHENVDSDILDTIEKFAQIMLRHSDRVRGSPIHVDGARSGILYDEIHISITRTSDWLEYLKGKNKSKGALARAERIAKITPYLFDVHDPFGCYADFDELGLRAWMRESEMTVQEIVDKYGEDGQRALNLHSKSNPRLTRYTVRHMYDLDYYGCWLKGSDEPIEFYAHEMPFIPVVVVTVEGSNRLFGRPEHQRMPFLYRVWKSNIWRRQNMALTAYFNRVRNNLWAAFDYEAPADAQNPDIDFSTTLNIVRRPPGTKLQWIPPDPGNNAILQAYNLAETKGSESTIYKQVAGQPLGPNATYSETALLSQAGRLPLIPVQRKLEWALGDALRLAFLWMKNDPQIYESYSRGVSYQLDANDIPGNLEIEVSLDVALPQDRLQQANIFNILKDRVPDEYLYENLLNERQPKEMVEKLWKQRVRDALISAELQQRLAMMAQQAQQAMPPPQPGIPMPGVPQETLGPAPAQPSGIPPEMMQGGMQGPEMMRGEQMPEGEL